MIIERLQRSGHIAGHSTIYITRGDNWFWKRPWPLLFFATFGTEILGTIIAVYGLFITPIGWQYAIYIWAYALVWFLINDVIKMMTHRFINHGNSIINSKKLTG